MDNLLCEIDNNIGLVTVNRPKSLNALNPETLIELEALFGELAQKDELTGVILTGAGDKAFVAGADISAMQDYDVLAGRQFGRLGHRALNAVAALPQPVIGAINGFALGGGCELALACDIRICSENAKFGQPEVNLGVIPGFGGTQRLPRLVGTGQALELMLTGDMIDAQEACRIGLVNRVVAQDELIAHCFGIMEKIGQKGPLAIKLCKEAVQSGMEMDLTRACRYEADLFSVCFASADQSEGMKAFLEKRKAEFKGK
ncbi:MAG: enoyl-CoA hydratase-related protein [Desulfofustis sp.]|jgi:enoyl-CoA hydratase